DCNGDRTPRFAKNSLYKSFCILSLSIFSGVDMYGEKPSGVFDGDGDAKDGESPPPASFFFTSPFFTNNDITSISLFVDCSNPPVVFILFWKISSADSLIKSWMLLFLYGIAVIDFDSFLNISDVTSLLSTLQGLSSDQTAAPWQPLPGQC